MTPPVPIPLPRKTNLCLLQPSQVPPSRPDLRVVGTFNPGAIATGPREVTLLVRVAEAPAESTRGWIGLPRWDVDRGEVVVDRFREEEVLFVDPRVVVVRRTGYKRLTFLSHIAVYLSPDGQRLHPEPRHRWWPAQPWEEYGIEDPRITPLEGRFHVTYVAVSRHGACTALASTRDFTRFERHGIIFPPENKDVVLFPERLQQRYVAIHRPNPNQHFSAPEMWVATSPDLLHWGGHQPLWGATGTWDVGRVGGGTPPIRTPAGWLTLYHGNDRPPDGTGVGTYSAGALLLAPDDPTRVIAMAGRILVPETSFETQGFVPNVVFPTGIVERGPSLWVYYGAADENCAVVELDRDTLLQALQPVRPRP